MKLALVMALCASAVAVSACATKRYPIATPASPAEMALMDCRDLQLELVRAEQVRHQIIETAQPDWRSVAGFLGDYGIGNAMAKSEAETALSARMAALQDTQVEKGCIPGKGGAIEAAEEAPAETGIKGEPSL